MSVKLFDGSDFNLQMKETKAFAFFLLKLYIRC